MYVFVACSRLRKHFPHAVVSGRINEFVDNICEGNKGRWNKI